VMPLDIFPLMQQFAETRTGLFQLVRAQREADQLTLRVGFEPSALAGSESELAGRVSEAFAAALGIPVKVALLPNAELLKNGPPNKIPRVVKP
jgi:phenylacetate-CoA ligase